MEAKTKLVITRKSRWLNKLRGYSVWIDGEKKGVIRNGDTEEFLVAPGKHIVRCKVDWCSSRDYEFTVNEGEIAYVEVNPGMRYQWYFVIPTVLLYFVYSYFRRMHWPYDYLLYALILCFAANMIYVLYYTVFSRKDYLVIEKDTTTLFGK